MLQKNLLNVSCNIRENPDWDDFSSWMGFHTSPDHRPVNNWNPSIEKDRQEIPKDNYKLVFGGQARFGVSAYKVNTPFREKEQHNLP